MLQEKKDLIYIIQYIFQKRKNIFRKIEGYEELYPITDGQEMSWRWSKNKMKEYIDDIIVTNNGTSFLYIKTTTNTR